MSENKSNRYSIRMRILDYSRKQLAFAALMEAACLLMLSVIVFRVPAEVRQPLILAWGSFAVTFIITLAAWFYKGRIDEEGPRRPMQVRSALFQMAGTIVLLVMLGVSWFLFHRAGIAHESITKMLGYSGLLLLVGCFVGFGIVKLKKRSSNF